jgi:hypothetical protein
VERHEVMWEIAFAALAAICVAVGFAGDDAGDGAWPSMQPIFEGVDWALTGIFGLEFGSRFLAARSGTSCLRGDWMDLLALVPLVRGLRILRLARLLRLVRAFARIAQGLSSVRSLVATAGWSGSTLAGEL